LLFLFLIFIESPIRFLLFLSPLHFCCSPKQIMARARFALIARVSAIVAVLSVVAGKSAHGGRWVSAPHQSFDPSFSAPVPPLPVTSRARVAVEILVTKTAAANLPEASFLLGDTAGYIWGGAGPSGPRRGPLGTARGHLAPVGVTGGQWGPLGTERGPVGTSGVHCHCARF
jgi:hypothetical protein